MSEQDWQSKGHRKLQNYFVYLRSQAKKNGVSEAELRKKWTIFRFNFETENDSSNGDGAYVKVLGKRRYCAGCGPNPTTGTQCPSNWK